MIVINSLSKKYKGADYFSVQDLSLTIRAKEVFGLLGPNGAGKTTLISMLSSLLKPTSGNFTIDGLSYQQHKSQLQQIIGIVPPQEYALYPSLTAQENLSYFGSMYGLKGGHALRLKISTYLDLLGGLSEFANKKFTPFREV